MPKTEHEKRMAVWNKAMKALTRPQRQALFVMFTKLPESHYFVYPDCEWAGFGEYRPGRGTIKALIRKGLAETGAPAEELRSDLMGPLITRNGTLATGYGGADQFRLTRDGIAVAKHLFNIVLEGEPLFTDKPKHPRY